MPRSFDAVTLVALPRLTALAAARLLKEVLTAAAAEATLPAPIAAKRDEVAAAHGDLEAQLQKRLAAANDETPGVRDADAAEDNAFGALFDWLAAIARLPVPAADDAAEVQQGMFPDGLVFLTRKPKDEWQEAETRLALMKEKGWDKTIVTLGGKPFVDELWRAHEAYGVAVGITAVKPAAEPPALRKTRDNALEHLRGYVLHVSAHVHKDKPETTALAERLLKPLSDWQGDKSARGKGKQNGAAPNPETPPAPAPAITPPTA